MSKIINSIPDLYAVLDSQEERDAALWEEVKDWGNIASDAAQKAEEAGRLWVRTTTKYVIENGGDEATILNAWLILLISGPDDSWSGRGNDARRAYFDGVRDQIDLLRREW